MIQNEKVAAALPQPTGEPSSTGVWLPLWMLCLWMGMLLISMAAARLTRYFSLIEPPPAGIWICVAVGAIGGVAMTMPHYWKVSQKSGKLIVKPAFVWLSIFGLAIGAVLVLLSAAATAPKKDPLMTAWNRERTLFEQSPDGFPVLRRFARDQFGLELVLGTDEDSFQATTHLAPGSSPGLMTVLPGYCQLGIWPVGIARAFPAPASDMAFPDRRAVFGVAVHEVGHCVDTTRDQASFKDPRVGTASIAPADRAAVKDIPTFIAAERKTETKLWREIYADLFAIGYMRLERKADAPVFQRTMLDERIAHASDDPTHATACWIRATLKEAPPDSLASLAQWAETHRAAPACKLPSGEASSKHDAPAGGSLGSA